MGGRAAFRPSRPDPAHGSVGGAGLGLARKGRRGAFPSLWVGEGSSLPSHPGPGERGEEASDEGNGLLLQLLRPGTELRLMGVSAG